MSVRSKPNREDEAPAEPEDDGDELPEGWASGRFDSIAELNPRHPSGLDDSQLVTFVPMTCVSESSPDFDRSNERPLAEVRKGYTHFADGDVLFAKITPCMENGKGAVATGLKNGLGCGTTELHVIRPLGGIEPHYVYRFLQQESVRRGAAANFTGSAGQLRAPISFIAELELPLPPLAEQRRIVGKLELLLGKVLSNQQRLFRVPGLLKRFRQSVLAAACTGKLTADWREEHPKSPSSILTALGDVCEIIGGSQPAKDHFIYEPRDGYIRFIQIRDYKSDNNLTFIPKSMARRFCSPTDVMIGRYGPPLFQILRGIDGAYNVALMKAVPRNLNTLANDFLFYLLQDPTLRNDVIQSSERTVGQDGVRRDLLEAYVVRIPALAEQQEIVRRVERLFAFADQIEARLSQAQAHVDGLTQSLLAKAFRGELVPTEHTLATREGRDYESASALLQRIEDTGRDTKPRPILKGNRK